MRTRLHQSSLEQEHALNPKDLATQVHDQNPELDGSPFMVNGKEVIGWHVESVTVGAQFENRVVLDLAE